MNLVEYKRKEQEERNKRDKEFNKQFDRLFDPKYLTFVHEINKFAPVRK